VITAEIDIAQAMPAVHLTDNQVSCETAQQSVMLDIAQRAAAVELSANGIVVEVVYWPNVRFRLLRHQGKIVRHLGKPVMVPLVEG
jgi:hypothetical protein